MAAADAPFAVGGGKANKGSLLFCAEAAKAAGKSRGEAREELVELWHSAYGKPTSSRDLTRANQAIAKKLAQVGYVAPPPACTRSTGGRFIYPNVRDAPSPPPEPRRLVGSSSSSSASAAAAGSSERFAWCSPSVGVPERRLGVRFGPSGSPDGFPPERRGPYSYPRARHYRQREVRAELWWQAPGAEVSCDGCGRRLPAGLMAQQLLPGRSRFAAWEHLCPSCHDARILFHEHEAANSLPEVGSSARFGNARDRTDKILLRSLGVQASILKTIFEQTYDR